MSGDSGKWLFFGFSIEGDFRGSLGSLFLQANMQPVREPVDSVSVEELHAMLSSGFGVCREDVEDKEWIGLDKCWVLGGAGQTIVLEKNGGDIFCGVVGCDELELAGGGRTDGDGLACEISRQFGPVLCFQVNLEFGVFLGIWFFKDGHLLRREYFVEDEGLCDLVETEWHDEVKLYIAGELADYAQKTGDFDRIATLHQKLIGGFLERLRGYGLDVEDFKEPEYIQKWQVQSINQPREIDNPSSSTKRPWWKFW